jgi:hypothetical protein
MKHIVLDKTEDIYLTLSYLALMMTLQVFEMSLLPKADLLNEDLLLESGKSMLAFNLHGHYLSAILTVAAKEDLESERQHIPAILKKLTFLKNTQRPHQTDAGQRRRHNLSSVSHKHNLGKLLHNRLNRRDWKCFDTFVL